MKKQGRSGVDSDGDDEDEDGQGREAALLHRGKKEKAVRKAMQQVLGQQDVGFRSAEQELALHAVINRQTLLIVVLLTSRGKSLLFSVLAYIDKARVIVVIVPY